MSKKKTRKIIVYLMLLAVVAWTIALGVAQFI